MKSLEVAMTVIRELADLKPWVYHRAITTDSWYMKFGDERLRSLRIANHEGKEKYSYKWNLRKDMSERHGRVEVSKGCTRYYYGWNEVEALCKHIRAYYDKILEGDANESP